MQLIPDSKSSKSFLGLVSLVAMGGLLTSSNCSIAQITPDSTLGAGRSVVTPDSGGVNVISGGATRGVNLFHSFEKFSVPTGGTALFNNPTDIQNIISRVTGESVSNIDGLLQAKGAANLFLLNPSGIIFGPNATLSIGGSFLASTANSLSFADGTLFSATAPQTTPLLTVSVPIGLRFEGNPARILVRGNVREQPSDLNDTTAGLQVQPNQTLAVVGGDVELESGKLKASGGRIELGGVASPGLVSLTPANQGWSLGYEGIQSFKDIKLSQQAAVDASGNGGGDIKVLGRQVILTDGSQIETNTPGLGAGGTLMVISSEFVKLTGTSSDGQTPTLLSNSVLPGAAAVGGNLTVKTERLIIGDGAGVIADMYGKGTAGSVTVAAQDSVELLGRSADGLYYSGLFSSVLPGAAGAGANLTVKTGRLIIGDGGQIFSGSFGKGTAGSVAVVAQDSVELLGVEKLTTPSGTRVQPSAISTTAHAGATATGGNLSLETQRLLVQDGAVISTASLGKGQGGSLSIKAADSVRLSGTSTNGIPSALSAKARGGKAGNLTIETGQLTVQDRAQVTVGNDRTAGAGILEISANSISLDTLGAITASTSQGDGGDIQLQARDRLLLQNDSSITASAGGTAKGGNIIINADFIAAVNNSTIRANAEQGRGGQVNLTAVGLFLSPNSSVTASSGLGPQFNGVVEINTPELDFSRATAQPVEGPQAPQVSTACSGSATAKQGTFIRAGAGGLPPGPTQTLSGDTTWRSDHSQAVTAQTVQEVNDEATLDEMPEAQGWVSNGDGTVRLVANLPGATPQNASASAAPTCQTVNPSKVQVGETSPESPTSNNFMGGLPPY